MADSILVALDDVVSSLFENNAEHVLKGTCVPSPGTNHPILIFKIDSVLLEAKVRAAMMARGF